ncbi:hypothetical protein COCC4DRAFT_55066 [Bipolaris maydis ATCC 48331]|uniref:Uncharacterized protein n=2 Tax=Cochliobolus heterostrophus TaxID=5016 RepID=M2V725_COCH5|nr:uncharacterized protein COCC4DRAFT_55066 [Bipolaris maydis ATCC 48331]EMD95538.1 hypothetical protein COCHEDRAFT_1090267 [Bipolaris maydis C5]KAJ6213649.1 hypothetical protein PSV09DRAFT_1090267 [Bipolaris maydis]ENI10402.1 hypothetical protein COCC4DRAFT_55066 [Bipolaris maydis ATCC 48331]KAJ6274864.1 hypothetical protein PSV08DRAFT_368318 [Bipolaris maydis]KAJ6285849.1 hypothetical protein J3E71DRAFT_168594 [Bipolaris maydis]
MGIPTTTALGAPHESVCKTETTSASSSHETGGTRADEGEAGEKPNHTVSNDPKQDVTQTQAKKRFCTFAVNNGLTDSPGLPPELRLMVYKAAFPEMDPFLVYESPDDYAKNKLVFIGPIGHCDHHAYLLKDPILGDVVCARCARAPPKNDRLRAALGSNFARDPVTRLEFLTEYVRQVQFCCKPRYHHHHDRDHRDLQQFLSILAASNLIESFRYLTILVPWNGVGTKHTPLPKSDAIYIAYVLTILYRYKPKCELTFYHYNTRILRRLLDRIVELGQTNPLRHRIGNSDQGSRSNFADFSKASGDLVRQDELLDKLSRRLKRDVFRTRRAKAEHKYETLKYPIDFSKWSICGKQRWFLEIPKSLHAS